MNSKHPDPHPDPHPDQPEGSFDPFNPPELETRYGWMSHFRKECPVASVADNRWYAASHGGVTFGLKEVETFVGSFIDTSVLPEDEVPISAMPEPRHGKVRRVINGVLAPHRTMRTDKFVYELSHSLLDAAKSAQTFDLVQQYVDPIPSTTIAYVLGVPTSDFEKFRRWSDELLENQNAQLGGEPKTLTQTHPEFADYIQHHIDIRRRDPKPKADLITRFINADIDGQPLSDEMIRTQTITLIIAGNETTRNWLGNYFATLAGDAELFQQLRDQPEIREQFMEESLRLDCPVQVVARAAMCDTEIDGQAIPQGDQVVFGIASANRDEAVFDDPGEFDLERPNLKRHLSFGTGPHICPGASLARLEARIALEVFCERVRSVEIVPDYEFQYNPVFWALGLRSLPVNLEMDT